MQEKEDSYLVIKIQEDNYEAFEVLYNRYHKKIYSYSYQYLKNHSHTEELLQSVFVSLWEHRLSLDKSLPVSNYIYRCAANKIYDFLRQKYVHGKFVEHQKNHAQTGENNTIEEVYLTDLKESIDSIIDSLPPQQKNIFVMSRYKYLTNKEIANKMNISVRTVEAHIYNVIKTIRRKLMI